MSTYQTPRSRGLARPSFGISHSPSNFSASTSSAAFSKTMRASTAVQPSTPASMTSGSELGVGDLVNVPGEMYGTVKFIGSVQGKAGVFVGVELAPRFASRGKNDGDVEGVSYFETEVRGAGIFLPVHRAEKKMTPGSSGSGGASGELGDYPGTPGTPTYSTVNGARTTGAMGKGTPSIPAGKFAQSVGPGVRPSSPQFKPKRPSLPRPESPLRRQPPNLAPTPGSARNLSQSVIGSSRTPAKSSTSNNFGRSTTTRPTPQQATREARSYSRSSSRLASNTTNGTTRTSSDEEKTPVGVVAAQSNGRTTSSGSVPSFSQPLRSPSRLGSSDGQASEIQRLKKELQERDRRLDEQAASLAEMEASVKELSSILPESSSQNTRSELSGEETIPQLRQMLREKNEKIGLLTAEFDAHRADFRSTLDSLEMASTETERVYEEQKRDLQAQLAEIRQGKEDFDSVAQQLKALEDLVAELEEGLEESRRGEAEARGEVEFLRGEVERGRSELKREREKKGSSSGVSRDDSASSDREMEKKDDEIRGLKALIHSLSSGDVGTDTTASTNGADHDDEEITRLKEELEESRKLKEELEQEVETLRREAASVNGNGHVNHMRNESERTATAPSLENGSSAAGVRSRGDTIKPPAALFSSASSTNKASPTKPNGTSRPTSSQAPKPITTPAAESGESVYCEMCESATHDTLDCTKFIQSSPRNSMKKAPAPSSTSAPAVSSPLPAYSPGKENEADAGANGKVEVDEDKWCALCEEEGHLAFDCPNEQY